MKNPVYIISFGDSKKYRFSPSSEAETLSSVDDSVKKFIARKFPLLDDTLYYDKMQITPVDSSDAELYADYPEFDENSLEEIKKTLAREIEDQESVSRLNSNDPWGA